MLDYDGFTWFGKNRLDLKRTAKSGSGGVGIFIKNSILDEFQVDIVDSNFDGILALKITQNETDKDIVLCVTYLPPEGGERGQDSQAFFENLLNIVYQCEDCDIFLFAGDLNARIGDLHDYAPNIDEVDGRHVIDFTKNKHGEAFCDFLKDSKFCVLNGRIDKNNDNFTSISKKGSSVVDYVYLPHSNVNLVKHFAVHTVKDICSSIGYLPDVSLPDHSVLTCILELREWKIRFKEQGTSSSKANENRKIFKPKQFKLQKIDENFLESCRDEINETIEKLEKCQARQQEIDDIYDDLKNMYIRELDKQVPMLKPQNQKVQ